MLKNVPNIVTIGVRFDFDRVKAISGSTSYGLACWNVFWRAIEPTELGQAVLSAGDTAATLSGQENVFCIAVQSLDASIVDRVKKALFSKSEEFKKVCAVPMFASGLSCTAEPLPEAARIDPDGKLQDCRGTAYDAWKAVMAGHCDAEGPEPGVVPSSTAPAPSDRAARRPRRAPRTAPAILVACRCGKRYRARAEDFGKRATCPACGAPLEIHGVTARTAQAGKKTGGTSRRVPAVPTADMHDHPAHAGPTECASRSPEERAEPPAMHAGHTGESAGISAQLPASNAPWAKPGQPSPETRHLRVACACGREHTVALAHAGRKARCGCGGIVMVPTVPAEKPTGARPSTPETADSLHPQLPFDRATDTEGQSQATGSGGCGWEITDSTGTLLRPSSTQQLAEWLSAGTISLDDECFDTRACAKWQSKPYAERSWLEKRKTETSFRAPLRETLKRKFKHYALFDPVAAYEKEGFKNGTGIVAVVLTLISLVMMVPLLMDFYHIGVLGAIVTTVLIVVTMPTTIGPFIVAFCVAKISGHGNPYTPPMGLGIALMLNLVTGAIIGGIPGAIVGHFRGCKTCPELQVQRAERPQKCNRTTLMTVYSVFYCVSAPLGGIGCALYWSDGHYLLSAFGLAWCFVGAVGAYGVYRMRPWAVSLPLLSSVLFIVTGVIEVWAGVVPWSAPDIILRSLWWMAALCTIAYFLRPEIRSRFRNEEANTQLDRGCL